jgi:cupin 2 domain-containing protein
MNIFNTKKTPSVGSETFNTLFENKNIKIEHIQSKTFTNGEWYNQDKLEWVFLAKGEAKIEFKNHIQTLIAGDYLLIEAHQQHRVLFTSDDTHWIALHVKQD